MEELLVLPAGSKWRHRQHERGADRGADNGGRAQEVLETTSNRCHDQQGGTDWARISKIGPSTGEVSLVARRGGTRRIFIPNDGWPRSIAGRAAGCGQLHHLHR